MWIGIALGVIIVTSIVLAGMCGLSLLMIKKPNKKTNLYFSISWISTVLINIIFVFVFQEQLKDWNQSKQDLYNKFL